VVAILGGRGGRVQGAAGGLKIRRRLKTCPTIRRGVVEGGAAVVLRSSDLSSVLQAVLYILGYRKILRSVRFFLISDM
jgi:hypothetical protein